MKEPTATTAASRLPDVTTRPTARLRRGPLCLAVGSLLSIGLGVMVSFGTGAALIVVGGLLWLELTMHGLLKSRGKGKADAGHRVDRRE